MAAHDVHDAHDARVGEAPQNPLVHDIFRHMDRIAQACDSQFPLYRKARDQPWKLSRRGSWLGGFWAALWWKRAAVERTATSIDTARQWSRRLEPVLPQASINRSFVFWYGAGVANQYDSDSAWHALSSAACARLRNSYDHQQKMYPLGQDMGGGPEGDRILNVDSLASLLLLTHLHGDPLDMTLGRQHLDTCVAQLADADGRWATQVMPGVAHENRHASLIWSARGQAWAMLGLAQAVRCYGDDYQAAALLACQWWRQVRSQQNQPAESSRPWPLPSAAAGASEFDPCASAIACVALEQMSRQMSGQPWLREAAQQERANLVSCMVGENGIFAGHLYKVDAQAASIVETPCALYFLLEAVMAAVSD
ncbi:hypothetical protein CAP48_18260 [Advenella sp. S44]|uniref:Glucuronyl hydrolase n=1 Tax=Advenella kashmirensis TaxID=310575 RepID=A0A356LAY0_9BURK|nr:MULTISPECIES: glucuronyl hydrolase [unclassified Advenella]PJX20352.1 hypothetical protein CAP48_18260 [Advenella sp. S44]HBP28170.1 glucuronyl hydrolase [Advenella kashmirensis]